MQVPVTLWYRRFEDKWVYNHLEICWKTHTPVAKSEQQNSWNHAIWRCEYHFMDKGKVIPTIYHAITFGGE